MSRSHSVSIGQPKYKPLDPNSDDQELQRSGKDKLKSHRIGRVRYHDGQVRKSYERAVAEEMARGCTEEVAGQRVLQAYGNSLPHEDFIAKGIAAADTVQSRFFETADCYVDADAHSPRCEALRKCRLDNPRLFKALQSL